MNYIGQFVNGPTYEIDDVVTTGTLQAIAVAQTTDSPVPAPTGPPEYLTDGATWVTQFQTTSVDTANEYVMAASAFVQEFRVEVTPDNVNLVHVVTFIVNGNVTGTHTFVPTSAGLFTLKTYYDGIGPEAVYPITPFVLVAGDVVRINLNVTKTTDNLRVDWQEDLDYWNGFTNPLISSAKGIKDTVDTLDAYNVDFQIQPAAVSTDWEYLSLTSGTGGGGGGSFIPDTFAGIGTTGYVPDPLAGTNTRILATDGSWREENRKIHIEGSVVFTVGTLGGEDFASIDEAISHIADIPISTGDPSVTTGDSARRTYSLNLSAETFNEPDITLNNILTPIFITGSGTLNCNFEIQNNSVLDIGNGTFSGTWTTRNGGYLIIRNDNGATYNADTSAVNLQVWGGLCQLWWNNSLNTLWSSSFGQTLCTDLVVNEWVLIDYSSRFSGRSLSSTTGTPFGSPTSINTGVVSVAREGVIALDGNLTINGTGWSTNPFSCIYAETGGTYNSAGFVNNSDIAKDTNLPVGEFGPDGAVIFYPTGGVNSVPAGPPGPFIEGVKNFSDFGLIDSFNTRSAVQRAYRALSKNDLLAAEEQVLNFTGQGVGIQEETGKTTVAIQGVSLKGWSYPNPILIFDTGQSNPEGLEPSVTDPNPTPNAKVHVWMRNDPLTGQQDPWDYTDGSWGWQSSVNLDDTAVADKGAPLDPYVGVQRGQNGHQGFALATRLAEELGVDVYLAGAYQGGGGLHLWEPAGPMETRCDELFAHVITTSELVAAGLTLPHIFRWGQSETNARNDIEPNYYTDPLVYKDRWIALFDSKDGTWWDKEDTLMFLTEPTEVANWSGTPNGPDYPWRWDGMAAVNRYTQENVVLTTSVGLPTTEALDVHFTGDGQNYIGYKQQGDIVMGQIPPNAMEGTELARDKSPILGGDLSGTNPDQHHRILEVRRYEVGGWDLLSPLVIDDLDTWVFNGNTLPVPFHLLNENLTHDYSLGAFNLGVVLPAMVEFSGVHSMARNTNGFGMGALFKGSATFQNSPGVSANLSSYYTFHGQGTFQSDGGGAATPITQTALTTFFDQSTIQGINSGTLQIGNWTQYQAQGTINAGGIVDVRKSYVTSPLGAMDGQLDAEMGFVSHLTQGAVRTHITLGTIDPKLDGDYALWQQDNLRWHFNGGERHAQISEGGTTGKTLTTTEFGYNHTGTGSKTVTLPSASVDATIQPGHTFKVYNGSTGTVTIARGSGQTLNGAAANQGFANKGMIEITYMGSNDWVTSFSGQT
jgi:hypothetical protein